MENFIKIIDIIIWPIFVLVIYLFNYKSIKDMLDSLKKRIMNNAPIDIKGIKIGSVPINLPNLGIDNKITKEYFALIHSSWRYSKKDKEFGIKMYGIQVILQAQPEVLDKVEYVKYYLHKSYPNPIQTKQDRQKNFELKELAWGEYKIKADVKLKNATDLITLERYINLTETGSELLV